MQHSKKIKASPKPYKNKKKLLSEKMNSDKKVVSNSVLSLPEKETPSSKHKQTDLKVQKASGPTSNNKIETPISEKLINELSKKFITNYKTIKNYFPKTYNTSFITSPTSKKIVTVDSRKISSPNFTTNTTHNHTKNQTSNFNSNPSISSSNQNLYKNLVNQSNSYYENLVRNMIQPGGKTRVIVGGKETKVDSTQIIERLEKQGGVVPMFQAGGMVTKPTLGLLGEAGPEMISPMNNASNILMGAIKSPVGMVKSAASAYYNNAKEMITDPVGSIKKKFSSVSNFFGFGGGESTEIKNTTNNTTNLGDMKGTLVKNQNLPSAVNALENKTNYNINNMSTTNNNQAKNPEAPYNGNEFTFDRPNPKSTSARDGEIGMGSGMQGFDRFFSNKNFSMPEWRQRMG